MVVGPPNNAGVDGYFGESGKNTLRAIFYNTSAVGNSPTGKTLSKISYSPISEGDFTVLREQATLRCLNAKAKRNPCDPAGELILLLYFAF